MLEKFKKLPLRKGVGIVLLNQNNEVFVAKRIDNPNNYWQMPQGGIDENENYQTYLLPQNLLGIIWKGKYKGQIQKWFCMRFLGSDNEINIKTKKPEFLEWKWINLEDITKNVVDFKLDVYNEVKKKVLDILK